MPKKKTAKKTATKKVAKKAAKKLSPTISKADSINIVGANQHNLKNLSLQIPHGELTVITGPSGSGKSSLAFHTLYAEGQRRYVETFSPYVRQFMDRMDKPVVERIDNIPPAIAVEQKNNIRTTRSTVGTLTELNDYLKVIFPRLAKAYDPNNGKEIKPDTPASIIATLLAEHADSNALITFSIPTPSNSTFAEICTMLEQQGYLRILLDGEIYRTDSEDEGKKLTEKNITIIQDRVKLNARNKSRLHEAIEAALDNGKGNISCIVDKHTLGFSSLWTNPDTGFTLAPPTAAHFSFNSPIGACEACRGFGKVIGIDLHKAIQDPSLSLKKGAVKPFQTSRGAECQGDLIAAAKANGISVTTPWHELSKKEQSWVIQGENGDADELWRNGQWYGVRGFFDWMESKAYKMHVRVFLANYRAYTDCKECDGTRLKPYAQCFFLNGYTLPELWQLPLIELKKFFDEIPNEQPNNSVKHALTEIKARLHYLNEVGLSYLTLDRPARTLSGGEIERVNLTTCLGAALTNTLFVLDEPTVGLHAQDIHRLIKVMHDLRDKGNTVVVVEHEEAVMEATDNLIDIGPKAGEQGGNIVFNGPLPKARERKNASNQKSLTLQYLSGEKSIPIPKKRRKSKKNLSITGAHQHNIENLSVKIPVGIITCLTGLSGSGKSTLANDVIFNNLLDQLHQPTETPPAFIKKITGVQHFDSVERVDQSPLTRTPRSTPAVYSGAFDAIRELFASCSVILSDSERKQAGNHKYQISNHKSPASAGLKPGFFSFNSGTGRCERCMGNGFEKVEMQFLSDLYITCPECDGSRYNSSAKKYTYLGKDIAETLALTVTESLEHFEVLEDDIPKVKNQKNKIYRALQPLVDVGLGYLRLGQPLNTLSGGESQRIKLCQLLSKAKSSNKSDQNSTLLILDEPTTGLHFTDIEKLLEVFHTLADTGHTLLIIEHNLDVIRSADHLIDLGPGAGTDGGKIMFTGTPEELAKEDTPTAIALSDKPGKKPKANKTAQRSRLTANSKNISLFGARENNLKNIDLSIPRDELVCITGLSGSGKSTIAFDIIFAEGQRRFLDSMSPYARQFAGQMEKPDVDKINGLPPTVAIEQRVSRGGGKSTVGTVTEIYHFLRLLYAKLGIQHCPVSGLPVVSQTLEAIHKQVTDYLTSNKNTLFLVPLVIAKKGYHTDIVAAAEKHGIQQVIADGKLVNCSDFTPLARYKEHDIYAVHPSGTLEHTELALKLGSDRCATAKVVKNKASEIINYSTSRVSPATGKSFEEPDPHHLSFNSPRGWCKECRGYGTISVTTGKKRSKRKKTNEFNSQLEEEIHQELAHSKDKDAVKVPCPDCHGARLREESRNILLNGISISEVTAHPVSEAIDLLETWDFTGRDKIISRDILPEIVQRLKFLAKVGLDYLSIDRSADTLSGGESQRIRLAAQLGSNLTGVLYILDEPTIGLHPRDNVQLLDTLETLKEKGNSLIVVEHDDETMARADTLINIGPGAGKEGGEVTTITDRNQSKNILADTEAIYGKTDKALLKPPRRKIPNIGEKDAWLKIKNCTHNNLKDIDVRIPLGRLTVITGVSGCGKSSLMRGTIAKIPTAKTSRQAASNFKSQITNHKSSSGFSQLKYTYEVDQTPIGKTSRSCPATYVKVFDDIRKLMALVPEARLRGYTASRFSFNNAEGQCPDCKGNGRVKLEMDFLPTTYVPCETCDQMRYNPATLEIRYNGRNIGDILQMSIAEASDFFANHTKLHRTLKLLNDTGLGYLQLGQPSPTLSGGEAQRIKLIAELTKGRASIRNMGPANKNLYLIEEPSIGLHAQDVNKLIDVLHRLVDEGHTVIIVEHQTAIMAQADYLIDMGPEAGEEGGTIVAQGKPEAVAKNKNSRTAPFIQKALDELK